MYYECILSERLPFTEIGGCIELTWTIQWTSLNDKLIQEDSCKRFLKKKLQIYAILLNKSAKYILFLEKL